MNSPPPPKERMNSISVPPTAQIRGPSLALLLSVRGYRWGAGTGFVGVMFIPSFVEIGKTFQQLKWSDTHMYSHGDCISVLPCVLREES